MLPVASSDRSSVDGERPLAPPCPPPIGRRRRALLLLGLLLAGLLLTLTLGQSRALLESERIIIAPSDVVGFPTGQAWGDMDADGDLDVAFSGISGYSGEPEAAVARVYENGGSGFFEYWSGTGLPGAPAWGDRDGDGDLDLAIGATILNNANGGFTAVFTAPGEPQGAPAWVDTNGDGWLDLALDGAVYRNSAGTLGSNPVTNLGQGAAAWADIDRDGDQDAVVGAAIYRNTNGVFNAIWQGSGDLLDVAWGDIDKDRDLDLAITDWDETLVLRNDGTTFADLWSLPYGGYLDVAWGDVNKDGYLDLGLAGDANSYGECAWFYFCPAVIYDNEDNYPDGRTFSAEPSWQSTEDVDFAEWVDWDADGDVDLATLFGSDYEWSSPALYVNSGLGWGDGYWEWFYSFYDECDADWANIDADTPLELVWVCGEHGALYEFRAGELVWQQDLPEDYKGYGLATADWDGDGDLDYAKGARVYRNQSGVFQLFWPAPDPNGYYRQPKWADWDGNGRVDLLFTDNERLYIYEFDPAANTFVFRWQSEPLGYMADYAWGDWDGDADLDLAVARGMWEEQTSLVLENRDGTLVQQWQSQVAGEAEAIAWGDMDADGDLDLALSQRSIRKQVYENQGGALDLAWESNEYGGLVAWRDFDNDGDLDLDGDVLHVNTGGILSPTGAAGCGRLCADADGDGDLDRWWYDGHADGVDVGMERNLLQGKEERFDYRSYATVRSPAPATSGFGISKILEDPVVPISYTLHRLDANKIGRVEAFYSLNGGGQWYPAVADVNSPALGSTQLTNLPADTDGADYIFYWNTRAEGSGLLGLFDNVVFRIDVYAHADDPAPAGTYRYPNAVSRSYQRPARVSARTTPFRVRGTQVQVLQQELQPGLEAAPGAIVYRLTPDQTKATAIGNGADRVFTTNTTGHLQGHGQLNPGDKLVALWPAPEDQQPPDDYPYTLYYTSAPVTADGLQMQPVEGDGVQQLTVSAANPLVLFDLVVSLEWDARNDPTFLQQLENDIGRASEILYDLTDGQAALGSVHLYHDKGHWGVANVVIPAGNHIRPAATLGGIVPRPQPDTAKNGAPIVDAFVPGQVRIGATWNRFGDAGGTLGEDWPRTLAHELGHYLFYLPDNYLGIENGALALVNCPGSAMSDPYRADYSEFLPEGSRWSGDCLKTVAEHYLGRADWETIDRDREGFYPALKTPAEAMEGPAALPLQVTQITPFEPQGDPTTLAAPFFNIADTSGGALAIPQGRGQAYLIKRQRGAAANDPTARYVVELGAPIGPLLNARGAASGDELCVFDYSVSATNTRLGCVTVGQNPGTVELAVAAGWRPLITVTGRANDEKTVDVVVSGAGGESAMTAQLLPALGAASPEVPMTRVGQNWQATLTVPDGQYNAAFYGHVRVWASAGRQTIVPYTNLEAWQGYAYAWGGYAYAWGNPQNAWGGYAYAWGGYAYAWGGYAYAWGAPIMSGDGQVSFLPEGSLFGASELLSFQSQTAAGLDPWLTQVGQAYRLRALDNTVPPGSILFRYLARDVPDGMEDHLTIYYQAEGATTWQRLSSTRQPDYNHVAAPAKPAPGTYALVATVEMTPFEAGWNVFAYPIAGSQPVGAALESLGDKYTSVLYFNNALDRWQVYDRTVAAEYTGLVNTLTELRYGEAYWLYATAPVTLYLSAPTTDAPLPAPPNRYFPPATYYGTVTPGTGFTPAAGDTLTATVGSAVCGQTILVAQGAALVYAVQVQAEALVGAADGCGRDGRAIIFTVRGVALSGPTAATWNNTQAHAHPLTGSGAPNNPPNAPANPSPANGATSVALSAALSWSGSDPENDPLTYEVRFGTANPPPTAVGSQSATAYDPPGNLAAHTTYYWQIVVQDDAHPGGTLGPIWSFTTANTAPAAATNPTPTNGATGVPVTTQVCWTASTDPDSDAVTYDVAFGSGNPPTPVASGQTGACYDPPGNLTHATIYYWRVTTKDAFGGATQGPLWSFTTAAGGTFPDVYYLSLAGTGSFMLGNLTGVKQADIVEYTYSTNTWRMVYQGSHANHNTPKNVAAFALLGDGSLLLVFGANQVIGGVTYMPWDIVKFTPNNPNSFPLGAGSYTMWLDGDKVGLSATGEKIDGLAASANGGMLHISTSGAAKVPKPGGSNLVAADEDVMTLTRSSATSGVWSATLRLDGSAVGNLGTSDVNAYWEDAASNRYLTVLGATPVNLGGGVSAYPKNIVKLAPNGGGWTPSIISWLASGTLPANLDGLEIKP